MKVESYCLSRDQRKHIGQNKHIFDNCKPKSSGAKTNRFFWRMCELGGKSKGTDPRTFEMIGVI